jgi:filamentous hemagglutinin family protein
MGRSKSLFNVGRSFLAAAAAMAVTPLIASPNPGALPSLREVRSGSATVQVSGTRMDVNQATRQASLDWDTFNVGSSAEVRFNQPDSKSVSFNRVLGSDPSVIAGKLSSNGRVILSNAQGILFAPGAEVNVGSLVASALQDASGDFSNGTATFSGRGGNVVNQGTITAADAGHVVLLGARVSNEGLITANAGKVLLGSGDAVRLDFAGDSLISLAVDASLVDAAVSNGGVIRVGEGVVILTAKAASGLATAVVQTGGLIEAKGLSRQGGTIRMDSANVTVNGTLDASSASAQGGEVYVHGTDSAAVAGSINVTGLTKGGFIDISAPALGDVNFDNLQLGKGGEILLDPKNIFIVTSGAAGSVLDPTSPTYNDGVNAIVDIQEGSATSYDTRYLDKFILAGKILTLLQNGINVRIEATNDITVAGPIASVIATTGNLTLVAGRNLTIASDIRISGAVTLLANANIFGQYTLYNTEYWNPGLGDPVPPNPDYLFIEDVYRGAALQDYDSTSRIAETNWDRDAGSALLDIRAGVRVKGSSVRLEAQTAGDRADRLSSVFGGALPGEIVGDIQISGTVEASTGDVTIVTPYGSLKATPASSIIAQGNIGIWAGQDAETGAMISRGTGITSFDFNPTDSVFGDGDYNATFVKDISGIWVQAVGDTTIKGAVTAFSDIRINDDITQTGGAVVVQNDITTDGVVVIRAATALTTEAITSNNDTIDLESNLDSTINGNLFAGDAISVLSNQGNVTAQSATSFNNLDINAARAITVNGDIQSAFGDVVVHSSLDPFDGPIQINGSVTAWNDVLIEADNASAITVTNAITAGGDVFILSSTDINGNRGDISLADVTAGEGGANNFVPLQGPIPAPLVILGNNVSSSGTLSAYGDVVVAAAGNADLTGGSATNDFNVGAAGNVTITGLVIADNAINITSNTGFVSATGGLAAGNTISLSAVDAISLGAAAATNDITLTFNGGAADLTLGGDIESFAGNIDLGSPNSITFDGGTGVNSEYITVTAALDIRNRPTIGTAIFAGTRADGVGFEFTANGVRDTLGLVDNSALGTAFFQVGSTTPVSVQYFDAVQEVRLTPFDALVDALRTGDTITTAFNTAFLNLDWTLGGLASTGPTATSGVNTWNFTVTPVNGFQVLRPGYVVVNVGPNGTPTAPQTYTITPRPIQVKAGDLSITYGDTTPTGGTFTYSFQNIPAGETASVGLTGTPVFTTDYDSTNAAARNAGLYSIYADVSGVASSNPNYIITSVDGVLTVRPASLTFRVVSKTITYGDTPYIGTPVLDRDYTVDAGSFKYTDTFGTIVTGSPTLVTAASSTSQARLDYNVALASGTLAYASGNYVPVFVDGTIHIDPAVLTGRVAIASRTYGSPEVDFTADAIEWTGFKNGETALDAFVSGNPSFAIEGAGLGIRNVGRYGVSANAGNLNSPNYDIGIIDPGFLQVDPKEVQVIADARTRRYGDANPNLTVRYFGFAYGQDINTAGVTGSASVSTLLNGTTGVGVYNDSLTVNATGLSAQNYTFTGVSGTMTITKAPLVVTAINQSRTYGDSTIITDGTSYVISGFRNGEDAATANVTGIPTISVSPTVTATSNVGTYNGAILVNGGTLNAANYEFTTAGNLVAGNLTVTRALLDVIVDNQYRVYGSSDPTLTYTFSGFKNSQTLATSGVTGAAAVSIDAAGRGSVADAGTYAITGLAGSLASTNYSFRMVNGVLTVAKASLTIRAVAASRQYGDALTGFTYTIDAAGFKNGQTEAVLRGTGALLGSAAVTAFQVDLVTPVQVGDNVGSYVLVATKSTLVAQNYTFEPPGTVYVPATLTITKAPLLVTARNATREYGDVNPAFGYDITGFIPTESSAILTGSPTVTTVATQSSNVGTYAITPTQNTLIDTTGNYSFTFVNGTLTISKAVLAVSSQALTSVYGDTVNSFTPSFSGFKVAGETATVVSGTAGFSRTAGSVAMLDVASSPYSYSVNNVSGLSATNYSFVASPTTANITITPAPVTLSGTNVSRYYGSTIGVSDAWQIVGLKNGQTTADVKSTQFTGAPTVTSSEAGNATTSAGSYTIGITNGDFAPIALSNYSFDNTSTPTTGTLTINKALLTVTANRTGTYGDLNPLSGLVFDALQVSGYVNGDSDLVTGTATFSSNYNTSAAATRGAGTYNLNANVTNLVVSNGNYTVTGGTGVLTIDKKQLDLKVANANRYYGDNNAQGALASATNGQLVSTYNDTVASVLTGSANFNFGGVDNTTDVGVYTVTATAGTLASANYTFGGIASGSLTINQAILTINAARNITYGDASPLAGITFSDDQVSGYKLGQSGQVTGTITFTSGYDTAAAGTRGAGTYAVTVNGASSLSSNYTVSTDGGNLVVAKATLTGQVNNAERFFGSSNPGFTATWSGFKYSETIDTIGKTGTLTLNTNANHASRPDGSPYVISATDSTLVSDNYEFGTVADGQLNITPLIPVDLERLRAFGSVESWTFGLASRPAESGVSKLDPGAQINFNDRSIQIVFPEFRDLTSDAEKKKKKDAVETTAQDAKSAPRTLSKN